MDAGWRRHPACLDGEFVWQPEIDVFANPLLSLDRPPVEGEKALGGRLFLDAEPTHHRRKVEGGRIL